MTLACVCRSCFCVSSFLQAWWQCLRGQKFVFVFSWVAPVACKRGGFFFCPARKCWNESARFLLPSFVLCFCFCFKGRTLPRVILSLRSPYVPCSLFPHVCPWRLFPSERRKTGQIPWFFFCGGLEKLFLVLWKPEWLILGCTFVHTVKLLLFRGCSFLARNLWQAIGTQKERKKISRFLCRSRHDPLCWVLFPKTLSVCYCQVIFFFFFYWNSVSQRASWERSVMWCWFYRFIVSICSISKTTKRQSRCPYSCKKKFVTRPEHISVAQAWLRWNF